MCQRGRAREIPLQTPHAPVASATSAEPRKRRRPRGTQGEGQDHPPPPELLQGDLSAADLTEAEKTELEQQFSVAEAATMKPVGSVLEMVASEYAPLAPGCQWVHLPATRTVLPVPVPTTAQQGADFWQVWHGAGTLLGLQQQSYVLAPVPSNASPALPALQTTALPVAISVSSYEGLLSMPLLQELRTSPTKIAQFLLQLYLLRLQPPGPVSGRNSVQPTVTDSWQRGEGGEAPIMGIEFELKSRVAGWYTDGSRSASSDTASPLVAATLRHSLTLLLDPVSDCVHEISCHAPAMAWDTLWHGQVDDDDEDGLALLRRIGLLPPVRVDSSATTPPLPGRLLTLQTLVEHATVLPGGPTQPPVIPQ